MSLRNFDRSRSNTRWFQVTPFVILAVFLAVPFVPTSAGAQTYGPGGGGGYGMMGGGVMMGGLGTQAQQQLTLSQATRFLEQSAASARVDKAHKQVIFSGTRIFIAVAAVQPGFPDTTFEVAGLVDPTIEVPADATVTLLFINMDYGPNMNHGVVITEVPPPYPVMGMMGMSGALAGVPVLGPRDRSDTNTARYPAQSVTFTAPASGGSYYYLCQYQDHASEGMFGRFVVR